MTITWKTRVVGRDVRTGRFVTVSYARRHPDTTVVETIRTRGKTKPGRR